MYSEVYSVLLKDRTMGNGKRGKGNSIRKSKTLYTCEKGHLLHYNVGAGTMKQ